MPISAFPALKYDSLVQQISGIALNAPTSLRSDLITGADARNMYFPNNTAILRFQLLHVTRAHSILLLNGRDPVSVIRVLRAELIKATSSGNIGMCGIDDISDTSLSPLSIIDGGKSWLSALPESLALIALVGWFVTLVFCGGCWTYYVCYTSKTPSADIVAIDSDMHATVATPVLITPPQTGVLLPQPKMVAPPPLPNRQNVANGAESIPATTLRTVSQKVIESNRAARGPAPDVRSKSVEQDRLSGQSMDSEMKLPRPINISIEFQRNNASRFMDMRLPSFEHHHPSTTISSNRTSCSGSAAAWVHSGVPAEVRLV